MSVHFEFSLLLPFKNFSPPLGYIFVHISTRIVFFFAISTARPGKVSHECDFEPDDICGWVTDIADGFKWKRTMASNVFHTFHTGPRHDHTTMQASGGHYMLMESFGTTSTPAALTSPIYERAISLKTACCFQFYYFMYGAGVGNLRVYIKPLTKMLSEVIDDKEK